MQISSMTANCTIYLYITMPVDVMRVLGSEYKRYTAKQRLYRKILENFIKYIS